jgi:secreted trypsin-like serine protease
VDSHEVRRAADPGADYDDTSPGPDVLCSGTLIAQPKGAPVFLTAGHCTAFLEAVGISQVWVTFAPSYDEDSISPAGLVPGTYVTHPGYPGKRPEANDLAVVLLASAPSATPATLPPLGLLDSMKSSHTLRDATFTTVGYGTVREDKRKGPQSIFFDGIRRYATQGYRSLNENWLNLSMNPSVGSGGTCYGDSGGPHFLGGPASTQIVSITVTGDRWCRATDVTYRLDTPSARQFLGEYVQLP